MSASSVEYRQMRAIAATQGVVYAKTTSTIRHAAFFFGEVPKTLESNAEMAKLIRMLIHLQWTCSSHRPHSSAPQTDLDSQKKREPEPTSLM